MLWKLLKYEDRGPEVEGWEPYNRTVDRGLNKSSSHKLTHLNIYKWMRFFNVRFHCRFLMVEWFLPSLTIQLDFNLINNFLWKEEKDYIMLHEVITWYVIHIIYQAHLNTLLCYLAIFNQRIHFKNNFTMLFILCWIPLKSLKRLLKETCNSYFYVTPKNHRLLFVSWKY